MVDPVSSVATSVAVKAGESVVSPVSRGIGQTFEDLWYIFFGYKWSEKRQKIELEVAHNVEKFRKELINKESQISDENRIEPDMDIVTSTLDSARFRLGKDEIRGMFSNLIISTMDRTKADDVHPSFSEMIKQLSSLDAQILCRLYSSKSVPIASVVIDFTSGGYTEFAKHILLLDLNNQHYESIEQVINNLLRLELIEVSYSRWILDDEEYSGYHHHPAFLEASLELEKITKERRDLSEILKQHEVRNATTGEFLSPDEKEKLKKQAEDEPSQVRLLKGSVSLTALGKNFCKICL